MFSPTAGRMKPLVIAHPLVIAGCWGALAAMLYWGYSTDFQQPSLWLGTSVMLLVLFIGVWSRRSRAKDRSVRATATKPVLNLESK